MAKAKPVPYIDPEASTFVHAAVAIATRLDELIAFEPVLADASLVVELHEMRIAAKRLRYTMDLFLTAYKEYSRYGKEYAGVVTEIKLLQEHLGEIHDADVLTPRLTTQLREIVSAKQGKRDKKAPEVGVHLVDLDACQGLLTMCIEARSKRDERFERLKSDWKRICDSGLFDGLRRLLRNAVTDETLTRALHESSASVAAEETTMEPLPTPIIAPAPEAILETTASNGDGNDENKTKYRKVRRRAQAAAE